MRWIIGCVLSLVVVLPASADLHLKQVFHMDLKKVGRQSFPATDTPSDIWYTKDKMAVVTQTTTIIFDFIKSKAFIVDHFNKFFVVAPLPIDIQKVFTKQALRLLEKRSTAVKITPNGQTRKIRDLTCSGYDVDITAIDSVKALGIGLGTTTTTSMVLWTTQELPLDWARHEQVVANQRKLQFYDDAAVAELAKISGYPVQTEITAEVKTIGAKPYSETSRIELIALSQEDAPPEIFAIPAGYTKREIFDPRGLGNWMGK